VAVAETVGFGQLTDGLGENLRPARYSSVRVGSGLLLCRPAFP
jgi:hypothetical protein